MFTGIVQAVGEIVKLKPLQIEAGKLDLSDVKVSDSVCVQGVCLTVIKKEKQFLRFDVSRETLRVTTGLN